MVFRIGVASVSMVLWILSGLLVLLDIFFGLGELIDSIWLLVFCFSNGIICVLAHIWIALVAIQELIDERIK